MPTNNNINYAPAAVNTGAPAPTPIGPLDAGPAAVPPGPGLGYVPTTSRAPIIPQVEQPVQTQLTPEGVTGPTVGASNQQRYITILANGVVVTNNAATLDFEGNGFTIANLGTNGATITINAAAGGYGNSDVVALLAGFGSNTLLTTGNVTGGNLRTTGVVSVTGNVTGGNLLAVGVINGQSMSVTGNVTGSYILGNGSQLTGIPASYGNANVVANLAALGSNPVSTTGNVTAGYILGNGSQLTGLAATYGNSNVTTLLASLGSNIISGTGNITTSSVLKISGSLSYIDVAGTGFIQNAGQGEMQISTVAGKPLIINTNAGAYGWNFGTAGNLTLPTGGTVSGTGNITTTANISGNYILGNGSQLTGIPASYGNANVVANLAALGSNPVSTTGNVTGGNLLTAGLISATGNITSNYFIGNGSLLTGVTVAAGTSIVNGTSNVAVGASGNATVSIAGTSNVVVWATTGSYITGLSSVSGNVTGGNVLTAGLISATGNLYGGNILNSGISSVTGNITGGNILTAGLISATGNITGGNVNTSALRPTSGALTISTVTGNLNLSPTSGNIVVNSTYINGVVDPVQDQDVATKKYVDNFATTAITYHQAVNAASTTTMATTTGGSITYTQPNGAGNGVGALLTTTGAFNLIDTANVQTVGTRILVKNEANSVFNGIYTWSNATAIVRSTDADEYGANSVTQLSLNDYFFVLDGNVNKGAAYICDAPTGTITFGTSNITFAQFSSSQTYTANTSAGISVAGTVINAKVDNTTTAFDGSGNISVKASANLTTPNIGAATGTSLSVTANVTGGNLLTAGLISATSTITSAANITGGNVLTAGLISSTGTITGSSHLGSVVSVTANITGGNVLTGGVISSTGTITSAANITGGNVLFGSGIVSGTGNIYGGNIIGTLAPTTLNASGNITGGNLLTGGLISATANITGGNITTGGLITATGNITSAANVTGGNILTGGIMSSTGNAIHGNILTGGLISATANITGGNITTAGLITASGNITSISNIAGGNILTGGLISATANITGGNILTGGLITATGNITGGNLIGIHANGTSNVNIPTASGNVTFGVNGTANILVVASTGIVANVSTTTTATPANGVGYIGMPVSSVTGTGTLTIVDAGKLVYITGASQTVTIPANGSVAFPIGTTVTFIAGPASSATSIAITTDTMYLAGTGSTGTRTLAANAMATAVKVASTTWYINGTGIS